MRCDTHKRRARKGKLWEKARGSKVDFLLRRGYLHCGAHRLICSWLCACPSTHLSGALALCQPRRVNACTRSCALVLHMDTHTHTSSSQGALAAVLTPRPRPVSSLIHNTPTQWDDSQEYPTELWSFPDSRARVARKRLRVATLIRSSRAPTACQVQARSAIGKQLSTHLSA